MDGPDTTAKVYVIKAKVNLVFNRTTLRSSLAPILPFKDALWLGGLEATVTVVALARGRAFNRYQQCRLVVVGLV
jgi:hypothetical protein